MPLRTISQFISALAFRTKEIPFLCVAVAAVAKVVAALFIVVLVIAVPITLVLYIGAYPALG
jgi:hypothetical protein